MKAQGEQGWFAVIAGKRRLACHRGEETPEPGSSPGVAFVQTNAQQPKRRLFERLSSQRMHANPQITFLSDSGEPVRALQRDLNPQAAHRLDWFHVAMRLTVLPQTAKGLPELTRDGEETSTLRDDVVRELERRKGFRWQGTVDRAWQGVPSVEMDLDAAGANGGAGTARKRLYAVEDYHPDIERHQAFIPNDGERYHHGERRSLSLVESTVNQVVSQRMLKKQPRQWGQRGAQLLWQIRTQVLNDDWGARFREWSPGFRSSSQRAAA